MFKWWQRFLEKLAEGNKKEFGDGKLDCCDLNQEEKQNSCQTNERNIK